MAGAWLVEPPTGPLRAFYGPSTGLLRAFYGPSTGRSERVEGAWWARGWWNRLQAFYGPSTGLWADPPPPGHRRGLNPQRADRAHRRGPQLAARPQPGQDHSSPPIHSLSYLRQCRHPWAGFRDVSGGCGPRR